MNIIKKIFESSTWWVGVIGALVAWLNAKFGLSIPVEAIVAGVGGYAVKEAAGKIGAQKQQ